MTLSEAARDAVWLKLPPRLAALDIRVRLLPWTPGEIIGFVAETLMNRLGTWSVAHPSAAPLFPAAGAGVIDVEASGDTVIARTERSAFRVRVNDKVRAFGFGGSRRVVLILPKARAKVTATGDEPWRFDHDPIDGLQRNSPVLEFPGDDPALRVAVRAADVERLRFEPGEAWLTALAKLAQSPFSNEATVLWETAVARLEVQPSSMEDHFSIEGLAAQGRLSVERRNEELPAYAAQVATFHPQNRLDG